MPLGPWRNWLTGETLLAESVEGAWSLSAGDPLQHFPVALLWSEAESG
jgi:maltooligosyltrehalose synthase